MENREILINRIKACDLSTKDKKILIELLQDDNFDLDKFTKKFITITKIGKNLLKLFDFDFGDD